MAVVIRVGIVGTGYAAKCRAAAFGQDERATVVAVAGYQPESTAAFAAQYGIGDSDQLSVTSEQLSAQSSMEQVGGEYWRGLVERADLDLVVVCSINREHGAIARAALAAGKHVVVEYPLALDPQEAADLMALAKAQGKLLHVEHIELLGGLHQTIRDYLPQLGQVYYAQYVTLAPKRQPLPHWTYHYENYGFPFVAALSRVNRLLDLFGEVVTATGSAHFVEAAIAGYYQSCLCGAQLKFHNGVIAHLTYGKGSLVQTGDRQFTLHGENGTLEFIGNQGRLIQGDTIQELDAGSRRGVFQQDTTAVLDYLTTDKPLYIQPEQSLYALQIADQIRQSCM